MVTEQHGQAGPTSRLSDAETIARSRSELGCFAMIFDRHAGEILRFAHARLDPHRGQLDPGRPGLGIGVEDTVLADHLPPVCSPQH